MTNPETTAQEAERLLPCPFCGGAVFLEQTQSEYRDRETGTYRRWWGVVCRNTENVGGSCAIEQRPSASEEAAVKRWNTRASQAPQVAAGEVDVGDLVYQGNTVSYIYARSRAYGDEIMRTWHVIKDAGLHPGRTDERLSDCVKRLLAAPPAPAVAEPVKSRALHPTWYSPNLNVPAPAQPAGEREPLTVAAVLRCRYPVCKSIDPSGWGWDVPRLNEVIALAGFTPKEGS